MTTANETRGEVDLILNETRFVLRPSHTAIVEVEKQTGKSCLLLAQQTIDTDMTLRDATIITTEFIKAWGKEGDTPEQRVAVVVDPERIGALIMDFGLLKVIGRLETVLLNAVMGGCTADGVFKEGEAMPAIGTIATLGAGLQASRVPPSAGRRGSSGTRPRTSSGRPSKRKKK